LSNAEISASLHISGNTVKTHVARVLAKLSLRDRVHAVIFGYESGLASSPSAATARVRSGSSQPGHCPDAVSRDPVWTDPEDIGR
jgi:hypothetical protein